MKFIYDVCQRYVLTQQHKWFERCRKAPTSRSLITCLLVLISTPAHAQITPDNTLGAEGSRLTPNVLIKDALGDRIEGGAQRGGNLFHSFSQFNVGDGQRVYFVNPVGVQNILTRVTGGQISNILGTLGVDGAANLFFLNPNGILFGPNARLDLGGSFVGTTANAFRFGEQGVFSATNPEAPPLLTVNPSALLLNQLNPGAITNRSQAPAGISLSGESVTGLRVPDGNSLLLVGGNINVEGGGLRAYGGNIELAGLAAPGVVGLNIAGNTLSVSVPNDVPRANVSLTNAAEVNVRGANGGSIAINAQNLSLAGESKLRAGIDTGLGTSQSKAGNIAINATGAMTLSDDSFIANVPQPTSVGKGGDINISTGSLALLNGSVLNTNTFGQGDAGSISIQAKDSVSLSYADILSNIERGGVGNGGDINIIAGSLSLKDGAQLQAGLRGTDTQNNLPGGRGNGGNINIDVGGAVTISGQKGGFISGIFSDLEAGAEGIGGNINIKSGTLSLTDSALLKASTNGRGNAGNVFIQASDFVSLVDSDINAVVDTAAIGNGSNININTRTFSATNGSELQASVRGQGIGGSIIINAGDRVIFDGKGEEINSRAIASLQPGAVGKAGDIQVTTGTLLVTNGAFLSSSTNSKGDAGNITIDARDTVKFDSEGSAISGVFNTGVGQGGDIKVTTGTLSLSGGSQISSNVSGQGNAGNIIINARDTVNLDDVVGNAITGIQSGLLTGGVGKGGNIQITTGSLSLTNGAALVASTDGRGNAGNITVDARDKVRFDTSEGNKYSSSASNSVGSNAVGNGGDIRISARTLSLTNGSQLNAATFGQGDAGNITVDARDTVSFDGVGSSFGIVSSAIAFGNQSNGGDIFITTGTLSLTNGGQLSSFSGKRAGNITINARDAINLDGVSSKGFSSSIATQLLPGGAGKGGDIRLTTGSLSVTNGAQLVSSTVGQGNGGNITIDARDNVKFDGVGSNGLSSGAYSTVEPGGVGNAGNIKLTAGSLSLSNGGQLSATTVGQGQAGDITLDVRNSVKFDGVGSNGRSSGVFSTVGSGGVGKGGNIRLTSNSLSLTNNAFLSTVTGGKGEAGNIFVQASDLVSLSNSGSILSNVISGGVGNSGIIDINARNLRVTDGSQIGAAVLRQSGNLPGGKGRGGEIRINTSDSVTLSGIGTTGFSSGIVALTERGASGDAGNIVLSTGNFRVADGAVVTAATFNDGNAGNVTINANNFEAVNGGQIANITRSSGNAGAIRLNVRDKITLSGTDPNYSNRLALIGEQIKSSGSTDRVSDVVLSESSASGIFASTAPGSTGQGGSIFIDPRQVIIRDGAKISVSSDGTGNAGDITLQAGTLALDNGTISAQTASTQGGNINLQLGEFLLLRRDSQISTTAGTAQAGGDGGNISINSPFIVAVPSENSDITANAFRGRGGNVNIRAQSIFGIQARQQGTPESDITATSELGVPGQISITQPEVQPGQGLIELPGQVVDASTQIAQICPRSPSAKPLGEFIITGRGSLPPNPLEPLPGTPNLSPLATLDGESYKADGGMRGRGDAGSFNTSKAVTEIVEAQGWVKDSDGNIILVAQVPQATPSSRPTASVCPAMK
ncbi:hypothetical protein BZZ01_15575 [Nostocales cyanobacterium HT-58-2]|nr:hypothetical protein BZZ01_15575 [Nostocales cyanobacterium HT-58-2]